MTLLRLSLLAAAAAMLGSCAAAVRYARIDPPAYALTVWLADDPLLDPVDALRGCMEWRAKGVVCRLTMDPARADVRVTVDDGPCVEDDKGLHTLALAYHGGSVVFNKKCFAVGSDYGRKMFRTVMTHEIGHEAGIWEHVPPKCDAKAARHDGRPICGRAVMNPLCDPDVNFVTVPDALAFDARGGADNALRPLDVADGRPAADDRPICVYHGK